MMNSQESINEETSGKRAEKKLEINAAALRFLQWINECPTINEQQRRATLKAVSSGGGGGSGGGGYSLFQQQPQNLACLKLKSGVHTFFVLDP